MEAIYITGIIVGGIVIIVFMLRDRITGGQASGEVNHGETKIKGQTKFEAAPPKAETKSETNRHYSIDIGGKTIFGFDKIKISLPSVRFFRDNFGGKTDFEISSDSNTSDSSPQIESQEADQTSVQESKAYLEQSESKKLSASETEPEKISEVERQYDTES